MKICGIICELNPFHEGHEYLFKEAKKVTGADYVVAVMSGDFVQRGIPAICDKYSRTRMALNGGADLVIELPVLYSTASADYFALGGVSALDSLGCVDFLCFGSETGNIEYLNSYVRKYFSFDNEAHIIGNSLSKNGYRDNVSTYLREGKSYARAIADITGNELGSNDVLGACYIKSLRMLKSNIKPVAIKRRGSGYLDSGEESNSATAIRNRILKGKDYSKLVPSYVREIFDDEEFEHFPISLDDFGVQLQTIINRIFRNEQRFKHVGKGLTEYMDVSTNLDGRIRANINDFTGYESFVSLVHSKEYTKSRVMRALLHILLDIRKSDYFEEMILNVTPYVRVLGFKKASSQILSEIKENSVIPIISKAKDAARILDDDAMKIFETDIYAANIYEEACAFKYGNNPVHDYSKEVVII